MTALLGPPPPEFLRRSGETSRYWSEDGERQPIPIKPSPVLIALIFVGTWKGPVPVPAGVSFEALATSLTGGDKELFLDFLSSLLCWLPEERLTAAQAYHHSWLRGSSEVE